MSGDGGGFATAKLLRESPFMEDFQLSTTRCGESGGTEICRSIKECTMLRKIDLSDNTFNIGGARALADSLPSLSRLVALNISDLNFDDTCMPLLLKALREPACPSLETLCIGNNNLTYKSMRFVATALRGKHGFRKLSMEGNLEIGNKGIERLWRGLSRHVPKDTLQDLEFQECGIHDRGAEFLAKIVAQHSTLHTISVDENMLSSKGIACVRKAFFDGKDLHDRKVERIFSAENNESEDEYESEEASDEDEHSDMGEEETVGLTLDSLPVPCSPFSFALKAQSQTIPKSTAISYGNFSAHVDDSKYPPTTGSLVDASKQHPPAPSQAKIVESSSQSLRLKLWDLFSSKAPSKLATLDLLLEKYSGNESGLMKLLEEKYKLPVTTMAKYLPSISTLQRKDDILPIQPQAAVQGSLRYDDDSFRSRLLSFYERHAPQKKQQVDLILAKYPDEKHRRSLVKQLEHKYSVAFEMTLGPSLRDKVVDLLGRFCPEKIDTVDLLLEKCRGDEAVVLSLIQEKHALKKAENATSEDKPVSFSVLSQEFNIRQGEKMEFETFDEAGMMRARLEACISSPQDFNTYGILRLNNKSIHPDAMTELALTIAKMHRLHTVDLTCITHDRDPAEGHALYR